MKINSKIAMAFFAALLALGSVNGMIIQKSLGGRPHLRERKEGGRLERRLMEEIKKEKEKNQMLKDLLQKQENLSQELDKKMLDTTTGQSDKADKATEGLSQQDKKSEDRSADNKSRKLGQTTGSLSKADSKPQTPAKDAKGAKEDNSRKLKQTGRGFENPKRAKPIVNNSKKSDKNTTGSKSRNEVWGLKKTQDTDARKLNDIAMRKRLQSTPTLNANSTRKVLRKAVVQKIATPSQKFKPVLPAKLTSQNAKRGVKRQLKAAPAKRAVKKLALRGHKEVTFKPLAKKVAINKANTKLSVRQHSTNGSLRSTKRVLNQTKASPSNRLAVQKHNGTPHVVANKNLKKMTSKPVAAKRRLSRASANKTGQNKRLSVYPAKKSKQPVRWTKHSRKLVGSSGKRHKHHNRILDEAEGADAYPVKLMNASISYPILGMVNLGSGEYDLHIS